MGPDVTPEGPDQGVCAAGTEARGLSKGKARWPYAFGVEVSITTTHREGRVVEARSMPGNPNDGHTLQDALEQAALLSEAKPGGGARSRLPWRYDNWRYRA